MPGRIARYPATEVIEGGTFELSDAMAAMMERAGAPIGRLRIGRANTAHGRQFTRDWPTPTGPTDRSVAILC
jgi:hypothetical protein